MPELQGKKRRALVNVDHDEILIKSRSEQKSVGNFYALS
jgi:hypothetical protein